MIRDSIMLHNHKKQWSGLGWRWNTHCRPALAFLDEWNEMPTLCIASVQDTVWSWRLSCDMHSSNGTFLVRILLPVLLGFSPSWGNDLAKQSRDAKHCVIACWKEWSALSDDNAVHRPGVKQYPVQFIKDYIMSPVLHLFPENVLESSSSVLLSCFKNKSCNWKERICKAGAVIKPQRLISPWLALSQ